MRVTYLPYRPGPCQQPRLRAMRRVGLGGLRRSLQCALRARRHRTAYICLPHGRRGGGGWWRWRLVAAVGRGALRCVARLACSVDAPPRARARARRPAAGTRLRSGAHGTRRLGAAASGAPRFRGGVRVRVSLTLTLTLTLPLTLTLTLTLPLTLALPLTLTLPLARTLSRARWPARC